MKCPKCGDDMKREKRLIATRALTLTAYDEVYLENDRKWTGDRIVPYACLQCGYIELYRVRLKQ